MHRYLTDSIISYYMDNEDPFVKYLFLKNFPGFAKTNKRPDYFNLKKYKFLSKRIKSGYLTDIKKWNRAETGAFWNLYVFIYLGFDYKDEFIKNTLDYFNSNYVSESGYFSFGWNPPAPSSLWTGEYLSLLIDSGYEGDQVEKMVKWIVNNQKNDGGWFSSPITNFSEAIKFVSIKTVNSNKKFDADEKSCVFSTISCLNALLKYSKLRNKEMSVSIEKAAGYLLNERIAFSDVLKSEDGFIVNNNFQSIGISIFGQIDIIKLCTLISKTKYRENGLIIPALNYLIKQKEKNEGWYFNSVSSYLLEKELGIHKNKAVDPIATIEMLNLLEKYS